MFIAIINIKHGGDTIGPTSAVDWINHIPYMQKQNLLSMESINSLSIDESQFTTIIYRYGCVKSYTTWSTAFSW